MLEFPLSEYFSYHPTSDPETLALYAKVNVCLFEVCQRLLDTHDLGQIDAADLALKTLIDSLGIDIMTYGWCCESRHNLIDTALVAPLGSRPEAILKHTQALKMFCNQGITLLQVSKPIVDPPTRIQLEATTDGWIAQIKVAGIDRFSLVTGTGCDPVAALADLYSQTESDAKFNGFNQSYVAKSQLWCPVFAGTEAIHPIDLETDGTKWCAKIGENLQVGTAGFGDDPTQALCNLFREFDLGRVGMAIVFDETGEGSLSIVAQGAI